MMRTDSLDRFGTRLEKRYTREQMEALLRGAGLTDIRFCSSVFWCAVGTRDRSNPVAATLLTSDRSRHACLMSIRGLCGRQRDSSIDCAIPPVALPACTSCELIWRYVAEVRALGELAGGVLLSLGPKPRPKSASQRARDPPSPSGFASPGLPAVAPALRATPHPFARRTRSHRRSPASRLTPTSETTAGTPTPEYWRALRAHLPLAHMSSSRGMRPTSMACRADSSISGDQGMHSPSKLPRSIMAPTIFSRKGILVRSSRRSGKRFSM